MTMTAEQKVKWLILLQYRKWVPGSIDIISEETIDDMYEELSGYDHLVDAKEEVRCSGVITDLPCPYSRHYDSDSVASQLPDGSWVGWTYWYGGGKWGCPEEIEWIGNSYVLSCTEKEVMKIEREFKQA